MVTDTRTHKTDASDNRQQSLHLRKDDALHLAHQLRERLIRSYGAQDVVIFGSVKGTAPWHEQSDLDLAVSGLPPLVLEKAAEELCESLPAWLKLDLIPSEQLPTDFLARLMEETQMSSRSIYQALGERLQHELTSLARLRDGLQAALLQLHTGGHDSPPDEFSTRALATYLDDFYSGCERIFERIAVTLDDGMPEGAQWHRKLLGQMADSSKEHRPPLLSGELTLEIDEYRRFRHRMRHLYGYELHAARVLELTRAVEPVFAEFALSVRNFIRWLEEQDMRKDA